jgi:acyl-CoA synthetase (AMP-forming)/AMP-acid ligase II
VIGLPDSVPARGEEIVAVVCLRDGMVADQKDLREVALQRLADFKVPQKIWQHGIRATRKIAGFNRTRR